MPQAIPIILAATAVAGVGMQIYGMSEQTKAAKESAEAQKGIVEQQQRQEELRKQTMEMQARRQQVQFVREQQKARSLALAGAVANNAQFGSGLQGGYGEIGGQTNWNALGVSQNLEIGQGMFASNSIISDRRIDMANASSRSATGSGLSSLGGSLVNSMGIIGKLSGGWNPSSNRQEFLTGLQENG